MISISTITPSSNPSVIIHEMRTSTLQKANARVSKIKTLDGGTFFSRRGFTNTDRTLTVNARLDKVKSGFLWNLFSDEELLNITFSDGCYSGIIESLAIDNGDIKMTIFLTEKLSS